MIEDESFQGIWPTEGAFLSLQSLESFIRIGLKKEK
jgi:hypothetical protein